MPIVEGFVAGILANRAIAASSTARAKAEEIRRDKRISEELGPVATEFNDAFGDRLKDRAEDIDNTDLLNLAYKWDVVEDQIDAYEVVFESEADAVDWLVEEIVGIEDVDLDETAEDELRELLADEFAEAVAEFRDRIEGNEDLEHRFQTDLQIEVLRHLDAMQEAFERLSSRRPYGLYDFPEEREEILDTLLPGDPVEFVDREEVPDEPEPDRHFVIAPSGSGKTRIIAERVNRSPDDAFEHVLVPENRMLDPSDAKALARESFDGDLLLVWEDVHRIDEAGENKVLDSVLRELAHALNEQGYQFYTLLEARSGRLHNVPGTFPEDFENEKSLWSDYEPLWVGELDEGPLRELTESMAAEYGVTLDEGAEDTLVERTITTQSAPIYIETVFETTAERGENRLTERDVEQLPKETSAIWRPIYDDLQDEASHEWHLLAAMKYLYGLNVPPFSKLVRSVYLDSDLLDGDRGRFRSAVESLQNRGWLTVVGDEVVAVETRYGVHDTQLDPIRVYGKDDASELSELLLAKSEKAVPEAVRPVAHFYSGVSFYEWDYHFESKKQWEASIELDAGFAEAHNNYALLLESEFDRFENAAHHYQQALDANPDDAETHNNYALLLESEFDRFEDAAHHYQQALDANPELAEAHYNYGVLLANHLDEKEEATNHIEESVHLWIDEGNIENAIHDLRKFVRVHQSLNNDENVLKNCELALNLLDQLDDEKSDETVWFKGRAALAELDDMETIRLYFLALGNVLSHHPKLAADLFEIVWERREEHDDESSEYGATVAAGVAVAAHLRLFDDFELSYTADELLAGIDSEELYQPEITVYQWLSDGENEETPEDLLTYTEEQEDDDNQLGKLETRAFAVLLNELQ